jgi:hypothetical protein
MPVVGVTSTGQFTKCFDFSCPIGCFENRTAGYERVCAKLCDTGDVRGRNATIYL